MTPKKKSVHSWNHVPGRDCRERSIDFDGKKEKRSREEIIEAP